MSDSHSHYRSQSRDNRINSNSDSTTAYTDNPLHNNNNNNNTNINNTNTDNHHDHDGAVYSVAKHFSTEIHLNHTAHRMSITQAPIIAIQSPIANNKYPHPHHHGHTPSMANTVVDAVVTSAVHTESITESIAANNQSALTGLNLPSSPNNNSTVINNNNNPIDTAAINNSSKSSKTFNYNTNSIHTTTNNNSNPDSSPAISPNNSSSSGYKSASKIAALAARFGGPVTSNSLQPHSASLSAALNRRRSSIGTVVSTSVTAGTATPTHLIQSEIFTSNPHKRPSFSDRSNSNSNNNGRRSSISAALANTNDPALLAALAAHEAAKSAQQDAATVVLEAAERALLRESNQSNSESPIHSPASGSDSDADLDEVLDQAASQPTVKLSSVMTEAAASAGLNKIDNNNNKINDSISPVSSTGSGSVLPSNTIDSNPTQRIKIDSAAANIIDDNNNNNDPIESQSLLGRPSSLTIRQRKSLSAALIKASKTPDRTPVRTPNRSPVRERKKSTILPPLSIDSNNDNTNTTITSNTITDNNANTDSNNKSSINNNPILIIINSIELLYKIILIILSLLLDLLMYNNLLLYIFPLLILIQSIYIPLRLALGSSIGSVGELFEHSDRYDLPIDLLILIGIFYSDYRDYTTGQWSILVRANNKKNKYYKTLIIDILSSLPYQFLFSGLFCAECLWLDPAAATIIRLNALYQLPKLIRLMRLFNTLDAFETRNLVTSSINPTLLRLIKLGTVMFLVANLAGCGYFTISYLESNNTTTITDNTTDNSTVDSTTTIDQSWCVPAHIRSAPFTAQYLHLIYWGFVAMTGNGEGVEKPVTSIQHAFTLIVLLIGISTYATLIGNLSGIIQQMNSKQENFREQMNGISSLMNNYKLPNEVQHRVKQCFQYIYGVGIDSNTNNTIDTDSDRTSSSGVDQWNILDQLPSYLRAEVLCHINGEIIHKVPLFRDVSDGFMRSLVPLLKPEVVIPGDYIIRTGEIGREMYLLRRGQMEVIAHGVLIATLNDGSYVGEVSLIFSQKRTASVRAVTFCDILVLSKDDFDSVLCQYPEVEKSMRMQALMRKNARSMQDKEFRAGHNGNNNDPHHDGDNDIQHQRQLSNQIGAHSRAQSRVPSPERSTVGNIISSILSPRNNRVVSPAPIPVTVPALVSVSIPSSTRSSPTAITTTNSDSTTNISSPTAASIASGSSQYRGGTAAGHARWKKLRMLTTNK